MDHEAVEKSIARRSAAIYLPLALGAAVVFLLAAGLLGYPPVARVGGAVWVGLLILIVAMPIVTSEVKKRNRA